MTSIASFLPKPKNKPVDFSADNGVGHQQKSKDNTEEQVQLIGTGPPPYRHRKGWLPRTLKDYGDGGAFPEIHVAQYPADMGRKRTAGNTNTVALRVGESGDIHYDAILRQGSNDYKQIQHRLTDIKPMDVKDSDEFSRPDSQVVAETAKRTQDALNKILMENNKAKNLKLGVTATAAVQKAEYFKYTPQQPEAGITNRIIRMVEAPVDPFEPPRFKHKKIPAGAKSPPAPVLHSPPRKISSEEQKEWFIPPCVSHWKNPKGYIVPLDKRLASDGRDLQGVGINDKFAHFAEALFIAERHAREEVEKRNQLNKKLAQKEKEMKEERLRQLALKAREQQMQEAAARFDEDDGIKERNRLRAQQAKDIRKQIRMSHMGQEAKLNYVAKLEDRDVSERIALNQNVSSGAAKAEAIYDQRLFNQDSGIGHGYNADDVYNIYDKPLFQTAATSGIYKPRQLNEDGPGEEEMEKLAQNDRFVPARGFQGADKAEPREGPVQFERENDAFGIDELIADVRQEVERSNEVQEKQHQKRRRED